MCRVSIPSDAVSTGLLRAGIALDKRYRLITSRIPILRFPVAWQNRDGFEQRSRSRFAVQRLPTKFANEPNIFMKAKPLLFLEVNRTQHLIENRTHIELAQHVYENRPVKLRKRVKMCSHVREKRAGAAAFESRYWSEPAGGNGGESGESGASTPPASELRAWPRMTAKDRIDDPEESSLKCSGLQNSCRKSKSPRVLDTPSIGVYADPCHVLTALPAAFPAC
jgi:hypothetical protein